MHIRVINPVITTRWEQDTRRTYVGAARVGTHVSVVSLDWGTASVDLDQSRSKRTYPHPPAKEIHWPSKGAFSA